MAVAEELPIDTSATALEMAQTMFGNGISILSAIYEGATGASGIFTDGDTIAPGVTPSDTGVILSTGNAEAITNSESSNGAANQKLFGLIMAQNISVASSLSGHCCAIPCRAVDGMG